MKGGSKYQPLLEYLRRSSQREVTLTFGKIEVLMGETLPDSARVKYRTRTADYQMTRVIRQILENDGNAEDLIASMMDRNLPIDEIEAQNLAEELLKNPPEQGYLTISNALQWRLQYSRVIQVAGDVDGVYQVR